MNQATTTFHPSPSGHFTVTTPSWWDRVVAWFLCLPTGFASRVPHAHWIKHSRLVMFVFCVVLPLSGLSWAHLVSLLIGPREDAILICTGFALFMMVSVCLMDSMLCGALAQRRFTAASLTVFCFRWLFALCAATSLAASAVLFMMGDQLARERAEQALTTQETDRTRVSGIHDLAGHDKALDAAKSGVAGATAFLNTTPTEVVALRNSNEACLTELKGLERQNSTRLPPLMGARERLSQQVRLIQASNDPAAAAALPGLSGRLREVDTEIGEFRRRVSLKSAECGRFLTRAEAADAEHKREASKAKAAAELVEADAGKAASEARRAATQQLDSLNATTEQAWSRNLSAQVKAAWTLVLKDWWALFMATVTFVICLVTELSPMLGKVALKGGALDQLAEVEEEIARQRYQSRLQAVMVEEEAARSVMPETQRERAEIAAYRRTAEAVYENAQLLRAQRDKVRDEPGMKEMADTVYMTACKKMSEHYIRHVGARGGA